MRIADKTEEIADRSLRIADKTGESTAEGDFNNHSRKVLD